MPIDCTHMGAAVFLQFFQSLMHSPASPCCSQEDTRQRATKLQELSADEQRQQQEREQEVAVVTQLLQQRKLSLEQLADLVSIAHSFKGQGVVASTRG